MKLNLLFKLSYLNSNFELTLGYLNPALNNSALRSDISGFAHVRDPVKTPTCMTSPKHHCNVLF